MHYETANFSFRELRVGASLINLATGREVYFQPGDDTAAMLDMIDALDEVLASRRDTIADIAFAEYFG